MASDCVPACDRSIFLGLPQYTRAADMKTLLPSPSLICHVPIVTQMALLVTDCIQVRPELYINMPVRFSIMSALGSILTLFVFVTSREKTYFFKRDSSTTSSGITNSFENEVDTL